MDVEKQLRRIAKLGITDFETVEDVERMQKDLLRRLKQSTVDPDRYAGLANCRIDYCGRVNCLEVCPFGAFKRRIIDVRAALRLLESVEGPFHEVRVSRALWSRPFEKLEEAGITAARQLNQRALDRLYNTDVIALGTFKVAPSPSHEAKRWICEIHQVVAGAKKEDLERVLSTKQFRGEMRTHKLQMFVDYLRVKEVRVLGPVVNELLKWNVSGWQAPWWDEAPVERPNKKQRREFYEWLLGLGPRARLICYGCDRKFKRLSKKPHRPPPPKTPKKRRYPHWLEPFFFGRGYREAVDPNCPHNSDPTIKTRRSLDMRLEKYFGDDSDTSYYGDID